MPLFLFQNNPDRVYIKKVWFFIGIQQLQSDLLSEQQSAKAGHAQLAADRQETNVKFKIKKNDSTIVCRKNRFR